jgi:replicative DNA helicase
LEEEKVLHAGLETYATKWPEFDYFTGGLAPQELAVISGVAGKGKSLFCRSMAYQLLKQGVSVGFIHFEGSQLDAFRPFEVDPNFKLWLPKKKEAGNPDWIIEQCYRFKAKHDGQVIFLDHLHYIVDMSTQQNMSLNIGALVRRLITEVAEPLNMVVVLIAHQQSIDTDKKEPSMDTIRDSSFLQQEPGLVVVINRSPDPGIEKGQDITYDQGYAMVKVEKARRKGTFRKKLTFQKKGDWLHELGYQDDALI